MSMPEEDGAVFNAEGLILGRMASAVAQQLLRGERVYIVNAEKTVVSGERSSLVRAWKDFLKVKSMANPKYGPFHSRRPDRIIRDAVRGMLPIEKAKGKGSLRRLRVYIGVPDSLKESQLKTIPEAAPKKLRRRYVLLGDLSTEIGWKRRGND